MPHEPRVDANPGYALGQLQRALQAAAQEVLLVVLWGREGLVRHRANLGLGSRGGGDLAALSLSRADLSLRRGAPCGSCSAAVRSPRFDVCNAADRWLT